MFGDILQLAHIKKGRSRCINGPGEIRHIFTTVDDKTENNYYVLRDLFLRMYWDDETTSSVEIPLGDFFCCGFAREFMVNSVPITVVPSRGFNCYFPMPFGRQAKIILENQHENTIPSCFFYQIDYVEYEENVLYFHAQLRRQRLTTLQNDYVILDQVKGRGHYV